MNPFIQDWIARRRAKEPLVFTSTEPAHGRTYRSTAVNVALIEPQVDEQAWLEIQGAWRELCKKADNLLGYVSYDSVSRMTKRPVLEIARVLRAQPADRVRFGVNRMGHNTIFKIVE